MRSTKSLPALFVALIATSLWAENPMVYFRTEDAVAYSNCVKSLKNVQRGELYTMTWDADADYHLDRFLVEGDCKTSIGALGWLCKNILNDAPQLPAVTSLGCSAFAATNAAGAWLAERNFDYRYQMTHALVYVPKSDTFNRPHASISSVDCGWIGYDVGGLDDGILDVSYAALFPFIPLDGMNDAGLMVTVLSLDGRVDPDTKQKTGMTEQYYSGRTNIVTTAAIRYLLDHAGSTEEGIHMLTNNFNMFQAIGGNIPIAANYHFYLCDKSGDTRVVEWLPPAKKGDSWTTWVTNATAVSNFYFYDGYGHGSNRWEILRHALAQQDGHLEEDDAMNLAHAVAQHKGAEQTSWTHWSIVYNLKDLSANIATLVNYDEIFPYRLKESGGWEFGSPASARPSVETNLPPFDASATATDRVYLWKNVPNPSNGESPLMDGGGVSAVDRMGCTSDSTATTPHVVIEAIMERNAAFYASMSAGVNECWGNHVVAGVNDKGISARVARLKNTGAAGTITINPSMALCTTLLKCNSEYAVDAVKSLSGQRSVSDRGVIFTDAKGNVAIWPEGAKLIEDDASEMIKYSLDLRKGIYEAEGKGRGQFDELPGLLRLAATDKTRAIISMGYGNLDVMLPGTNRVWRVALEDADIPRYGVVAEPPTVAHATMKSLTYANGNAIETNNQGRLVAEVGVKLKVTYTSEGGYFFSNGTGTLTQHFTVGETATTPPTETPAKPALKLGKATQRYPWNGIVDAKYQATNWPAGKEAGIEITMGDQREMLAFRPTGAGTINGSVPIDLRALFGETRGEVTFKAVVK